MNHCTFISTGDSSGAVFFFLLWTFILLLYVPPHFVYVPLKFHLFVSLLPLVSSSCYHLAVEATSVDVWPSTRAASFHGFVARSIHLRRIRDPWLLFSWPKKPKVTDLSVIRVGVHGALSGKSQGHSETTGEHLHSSHHWIQVVFFCSVL